MNQRISDKLINNLRHAGQPLHPQHLASLYDDPEQCHTDLARLEERGLVTVREVGIEWRGS